MLVEEVATDTTSSRAAACAGSSLSSLRHGVCSIDVCFGNE